MTTVRIYAHACLYAKGKKKIYAEEIIIRTIRRYRQLGLMMVSFEEDLSGTTTMKFIQKDA